MNLEEKVQLHDQIQKYLEKNNVYQTVQKMVEGLLINQPNDPIDFMISQLQKPEKQRILLVGPPGMRLYSIAEKVINQTNSQSGNNKCVPFNCGEYIFKSNTVLSPEESQFLKQCRIIHSPSVEKTLLEEINKLQKSDNDCLIEGFPKTLQQALLLQRNNFYPTKVIFVNVSDEHLKELCLKKMKHRNQNLAEDQINDLVRKTMSQYNINMKGLKRYYPTYLEIDGTLNRQQEEISQQIYRCLGFQFSQLRPRKNTQIIIIGAPKSGRTTLGKKIADKYNLTYVSTSILIAEEIRRETVTGRKIKQKYAAHELIDDFTIEKLIDERISQKCCQMQGFVLEGYPKNRQQWDNIKNLRIHPNFIIGLDVPEEVVLERLQKDKDETFSKRYEKWKSFKSSLAGQGKIFWLNPKFKIQNAFEEACFEIQNRKKM